MERDVQKLKDNLINLETVKGQIMKQRDEDAEMTKANLKEMKKQMKLMNMATSKRIAGVYNSVTMTKKERDKGIFDPSRHFSHK